MKGNRAFTFVEVLATLAFIGIALPVIMRAVTMSAAAVSGARHLTEATWLAQEMIGELTADADWGFSRLEGDFAPDYPDYAWTATLADWLGGAGDENVRELAVTVSWHARGEERSLSLATLVVLWPGGEDG